MGGDEMKKSLLLLLAALFLLAGCVYIPPVAIGVGQQSALRSPDPQVWRPDATRTVVQNYSHNIHLKIWVDKMPTGAPNLELAPEEGRMFNFSSVGTHRLYISGQERTSSGWKNLGARERLIEVYPGEGGRELPVGDWDFYDTVLYPWSYYHW